MAHGDSFLIAGPQILYVTFTYQVAEWATMYSPAGDWDGRVGGVVNRSSRSMRNGGMGVRLRRQEVGNIKPGRGSMVSPEGDRLSLRYDAGAQELRYGDGAGVPAESDNRLP